MGYFVSVQNCAFRAFWKVDIFITVATPQDNIIECLEAEVIRLKLELAQSEDRYLAKKKQFDELKVILRET